ncbi:MAG: hypothetical protein JSS49_24420 [Planctomycetes bacterium]|nr:hypothetical protein [Planctomycetota bacterium]
MTPSSVWILTGGHKSGGTSGAIFPRLWLMTLLCAVVAGCGKELQTQYAVPKGESINGISGFIELVKSQGHRTQLWRSVSQRMKYEFDVLILFQSSYDKIPKETLDNIREMMVDGSISTVLIVLRDSDCAIDYWRQVAAMPETSAEDKQGAQTAAADLAGDVKVGSFREYKAEVGQSFGMKRIDRKDAAPVIPVEFQVEGNPVTIQARWPLSRRLEPARDVEVLWSTGDEPLLIEDYDDAGQILVLVNAAPLLNGGMVDPGNRRLAEELVKLLPEQSRVAIALSSRWSDGKFADSPSILQFLKVHPHGWIFGQAVLALILFCWWKMPIVGRPRTAMDSETVRFGKHVEALGVLLQRTRDVTHARLLIRDWHRAELRRGYETQAPDVTNSNPAATDPEEE